MSKPAQSIETRYGISEFIKILDNLTEREKTILIRCDFESKTHAEIGKEVRLTPARVSQIVARARRRVSSALLNYIRIKTVFEENETKIRLLEFRLSQAESMLIQEGKPIPTADQVDATTVEDLNLSVRLYNALKSHKVNIVGEIKHVGNDILKWRTFGKKTYVELCEVMEELGIKWPVNEPQLY